MAMLNIFIASTNAADAILYALLNQKEYYDKKHQTLFMKIGNWAMLRLHKSYLIPFLAGVTKKLTQPYVGPFRIKQRIRRLA